MTTTAPAPRSSDRDLRNLALVVIGILTVVRLGIASSIELQGDEAYFWRWSRHLDWCYYSKGPGIALLIRGGTWLLGASELGVRLGAILASAAASFSLFALGRAFASARIGLWAVIVANTTPLWSAGSLLATADMPSVFIWTAAALWFWRLRDSRRLAGWAALGFVLGLGILTRFVVALELFAFTLFLAAEPASRRRPLRAGFGTMLVACIATLAPWFLGERAQGWVSWAPFLSRAGFDRPWGIHPLAFLEFAALQFVVVAPYGVAAIAAFFRAEESGFSPEATRYLRALSLPLLGLYAVLALNRPGQPNWTGPAYVAVALVVVAVFSRAALPPLTRRLTVFTVALAIVLTVGLHVALWTVSLEPERDPFARLRGSRDLATQVSGLAQRTGASFVIGDHYQVASLLSFYLPGQPEVSTTCFSRPANQLDLWGGYGESFLGRDALYVSRTPAIPTVLTSQFARIEPLGSLATHWRGHLGGRFYVSRCRRLVTSCAAGPGLSKPFAPSQSSQ